LRGLPLGEEKKKRKKGRRERGKPALLEMNSRKGERREKKKGEGATRFPAKKKKRGPREKEKGGEGKVSSFDSVIEKRKKERGRREGTI